LTIDDVTQVLRFRARQIEALESDASAVVAGDVFARGLLRSYARFLKLEPAEAGHAKSKDGFIWRLTDSGFGFALRWAMRHRDLGAGKKPMRQHKPRQEPALREATRGS
jgi:hypothetical protein